MTMMKRNIFLVVLIILIGCFHGALGMSLVGLRAPAVFPQEDAMMHKYSAVLAAAEPFRKQCIVDLKRTLGIKYLIYQLMGINIIDPNSSIRNNVKVDNICDRYENKLDEIVRSYGIPLVDFNYLSEQISINTKLKQRVLLQAYFYRIAAELETSTNPPVLPKLISKNSRYDLDSKYDSLDSSSKNFRNTGVTFNRYKGSSFQRFCSALRNMEVERVRTREKLRQGLNIVDLPPRMCDPSIQPAMCSSIREACSGFAKSSTSILEKHGVSKDEFERLQQKIKKDFFFRLRVEREIEKIEKIIKTRNSRNQ